MYKHLHMMLSHTHTHTHTHFDHYGVLVIFTVDHLGNIVLALARQASLDAMCRCQRVPPRAGQGIEDKWVVWNLQQRQLKLAVVT